jgi:hypothetical protein
MKLVECPRCGRKQLDDPKIKAVLVCTCGKLISAPEDPWGPGSRPAPGDIRFEGTRGEREDLAERGGP